MNDGASEFGGIGVPQVPRETKRWDAPAIFHNYDDYRRLFRPLTSQIVASALDSRVGNGRTVEIGSGMGELLRLMPAYRGKVEQTDPGAAVVAQRKEADPDIPITQVDVYHMPYQDASIDTVVGFAMLDTLHDLPASLTEIRRVLKPGGYMIHILDLMPDARPILSGSNREVLLLPAVNSYTHAIDGVHVIPTKYFQKKIESLPPNDLALLRTFMEDPATRFEELKALSADRTLRKLDKIARQIDNWDDGRTFLQTFDLQLSTAADRRFIVEKMSTQSAEKVSTRREAEITEYPPEINSVINDVGVTRYRHDKDFARTHGLDDVKMEAKAHVAILRKPT